MEIPAEDSPDARIDMSRIIRLFSGIVTGGGKIEKRPQHSRCGAS